MYSIIGAFLDVVYYEFNVKLKEEVNTTSENSESRILH